MDITFAEPEEVPEVNQDNCANTSNIVIDYVYSTTGLTSDSPFSGPSRMGLLATLPLAAAMITFFIL